MKNSSAAWIGLAVIAFCILLIEIIYMLPLTNSLKESLYSSIIGSGLVGLMASGAIYYIQHNSSYQTSKLKANDFFHVKLIPDLRELFKRAPSAWNLDGNNKFYFDGSYFNSLFEEFDKYFDNIFDYASYFPNEQLIKTLYSFYKDIREGYVLGEKVDGKVYQIVRAIHHSQNVDQMNDLDARRYTKARLMSSLPEEDILKYLSRSNKPERYDQIVSQSENDEEIKQWIQEIKVIRERLADTTNEIKKLIEESNTNI